MLAEMSIRTLHSDADEAKAEISWGSDKFTVEVTANVTLNKSYTPWLAVGIAHAMEKDISILHLDGPVDEEALSLSSPAQELVNLWWPERYRHVNIDAAVAANPESFPAGRGIGCFFSGGLDSFYSAINNLDDITHLIWVHGFDIYLSNTEYADVTRDSIRLAAKSLGKELIELTSNVRHIYDGNGRGWTHLGHGVALAHVAHLLSDHLHTVIIPASFSTGHFMPHGTHPELDHLWSGGAMRLVHDGADADRVMKARRIKDNVTAMSYLRVCYWNRTEFYNCGKCEKCVRTIINFRIAGGDGKCLTLPQVDPVRALRGVVVKENKVRESLDALKASEVQDVELERALEEALDRKTLANLKARLFESMRTGKILMLVIRGKIVKRTRPAA
ncbi:hypothetical protein [Tomitella biformata]|uniref:hypothetical protein n=1 Tax=Tomitella biformata TaxID=630403 RepID=UPI0011DD45D4|nr:hypothetical protein [Tomitella biformata]